MSSETHTFKELVHLALQTPENGVVNFNILRVVLLKIIEKLNFGEEEIEYKPPDIRSSLRKLPQIRYDPSYLKEPRQTKMRKETEKEPGLKDVIKASVSKEKDVYEVTESQDNVSNEDVKPDSTTPGEPEIIKELGDTPQEDVVSSTSSETFSPASEEDSEYEDESSEEIDEEHYNDEDIVDEKGKSKPRSKEKKKFSEKRKYSKEEDSGKRPSSPQIKKEEQSTDEEKKPKKLMPSMYHVWQMKKLSLKIDGFEEKLNSVVESVEQLMKFKEERERRTKFEEGQTLESEYSSPYISREEFENTIDDMGQALSRLFANQRQQKEECNTINQDILKELSLKASAEDLNRHSEPINSKFRTLGTAITDIQKLIKDVIFPEACGITKCMACGRKSQLPRRCIVLDGKKGASQYKDAIESIIKMSKEEKSEDLKFTNASFRRIDKHQKEKEHGVPQSSEQQDKHIKRPSFPDYQVELETLCDADKLSKEFSPLRRFPDLKRRNTLYVPAIRPGKNPVSPKHNPISVKIIGNDNHQIPIKN